MISGRCVYDFGSLQVAEPSTPSRPPSWDNLERSYSAKLGKTHVERVLQQNPDWGFQIVNGKISPSLEAVQRDYADPKTRAGVVKQLARHPELGFEEVDGTITQ